MNYGRIYRGAAVFKQIVYAKMTGKRMPIRIALQLTKYCNMRCNYCYVNFDRYKNIADRSKKELFDTIDELYRHGMRWLWFLGGEPMIRDDFGEIIDYAQHKGIFCDMNSNGVLINKKNIDVVKKLDGVCISIDGDEESNDYYRGKGSYEKAMMAVKLLREHNVAVRIHSVLTKRTWKTLDHVAQVSKELGTSFVFVEVLKNEPDENDHILTSDEEKQFYTKYMEYKRRGYPILHSFRDIHYVINYPKKNGEKIYRDEASKFPHYSYVPCLSGDLLGFLDIDGRLYSCNGTWEHGLNYYDVGLKKAWDYLGTRTCVSCNCIGMIKLHSLFRLDLVALLDDIKLCHLYLGKQHGSIAKKGVQYE